MPGGGVGTRVVGFEVVIDGLQNAGVWESWSGGGLQARHTVQDVAAVGRIPGAYKWAHITLKRGVGDNKVIFDWIKKAISGEEKTRDVKITEMGLTEEGQVQPIRTYTFVSAWPRKYSYPTLDKYSSGPAYESVSLRFARVEIT